MARIQLASLPAGTVLTAGTFTPASGATAFIYTHDPNSTAWGGANTPVQVTVFSTETGAGTLTQPVTANANGQFPGWVTSAQALDVLATPSAGGGPVVELAEAVDATATSGGGGGSTFGQTVVTKTASYTLTAGDEVVLGDATTAAFTLTVPTAVGFAGHYVLKAITTNSNLITVNTTASQTIDGNASGTFKLASLAGPGQFNSMILISDGVNWRMV